MRRGPAHPLATALALFAASVAFACAKSESAEPLGSARGVAGSATDPFAAIDGLSTTLARMAALARDQSAARVPYGRGEGALHVLRLMRRAIDEEIAWAGTDHPYFQVQDERYAKLALGNPDNLYLVARVEEGAAYRVRGRLGNTADFNLQVYQGYPGVHRPFLARGAIGVEELVTDDAGRFEITVGGPEQPGNWVPLAPGSRRILVRFTHGDWATEEAGAVVIERIGTRGERSQPVPDAEVARRIRAASAYLEDAMTGYLATVAQVMEGLTPNTLRPLRRMSGAVGGLSNQYNATGRYAVDEEHALIVTTRPSDAAYQGFQIGTEWFEALDFVNQTTSLNTRQARRSSDGLLHFVIATRDPGVANWLDASSAPQGQMLLRWQRVGALGPEHEPTVRLVPFDAIRDALPADEPVFDAAARRAQIAERQRAIARRHALGRL